MKKEAGGKTVVRRIIVTGGSRGIGAAAVRRFVKAGDRAAFLYHSSVEKAEALSAETGALSFRCDIGDPLSCRIGIRSALAALGGCDVLVNNAGISLVGLFTDASEADYDRIMSVNVGGAYRCTQEVLPFMIREKKGAIVNVSSMWGVSGASCEVLYSASKAALIGMTKALAKELGPSGITVNCVAPGVIDTEMNAALTESDRAALADETPLCRIGTPEEVAEVIFFLSSASFVTGQVLSADGGFTV